MSCPICGRNNCCKSFHSIEEQKVYEEVVDSVLPNILRGLKNSIDKIEGHYHGENYYIRLEDVLGAIDDII